jgi:TatD DNase family protein
MNKNIHIIDTHCHLQYHEKTHDLAEVMKICDTNRVNTIFNVGIKDIDAKIFTLKYQSLFQQHNINSYYSVGRHPSESAEPYNTNDIIKDAEDSVGIGETGLDFYRDNPIYEKQAENFINHIVAANHLKLPVIVHTRNAETETFDILQKNPCNFLIHCFTGTKDFAEKVLNLNGFISFSGIITYKNADELRQVVKYVPLDRILIETDAPYLTPMHYRKNYKDNQPAFIIETLQTISQIKEIPYEDLMKILYDNTRKCFSKMK